MRRFAITDRPVRLLAIAAGLSISSVSPVLAQSGGLEREGLFSDSGMSVLIGLVLLLFVGGSAIGMYRGRLSQGARDLAIWLILGAILVAGYGFRNEFRQIGHLMPPGEAQSISRADGQEQAVRIRKRSDGHFVAKTEVNGVTVTMLVDTGASSVVLKPADARLAGVDVDRLTYSVPVQTANGTAYAAAVRLKRLSVGGITVDGIEALVAKPGTLGESLLGMTFLRRLRSYEFTGEFLTLRS
jgi:aspartyl protease family protein